jgi:asparagine synthase (glutamine-hydrolysing)
LSDLFHSAAARRETSFKDPFRLDQILRLDLALSLPGDMLHKVDLASMYHSLEVRVPLLSRGVVDFATSLPIHFKIDGMRRKRILIDAFREDLPPAILTRSKMGFEVPVGDFLRNELRDMYRDVVSPDRLDEFGINAAAAQSAFDRHQSRAEDHTELLWSLMTLCWWRRQLP